MVTSNGLCVIAHRAAPCSLQFPCPVSVAVSGVFSTTYIFVIIQNPAFWTFFSNLLDSGPITILVIISNDYVYSIEVYIPL